MRFSQTPASEVRSVTGRDSEDQGTDAGELPAPVAQLLPPGVAESPGLFIGAGLLVLAYRHRAAITAVVRRILGRLRVTPSATR